MRREESVEQGTSLWHRSGALRWTVYLLLIFVVAPVTLWVTLDTINRRKVARQLQAIRDAGYPVTMTEAAPALVPDDQNAAILYQQVFRVDLSNPHSNSHSLLDAPGHSDLIEDEFVGQGSKAAQARPVLEDPAVISILETLEQASMRPEGVFHVNWEDVASVAFPHRNALLQAARWLCAKTRLCIVDGDADEALRWIGVIFRMSDHMAQEPACLAQRVAVQVRAIGSTELERTLSRTKPSADAAQSMLDWLGRLDVKERFNKTLAGERALVINTYAQLRRPGNGMGRMFGRFPEMKLLYCYQFRAFRPLYNADLNKYLTRMEEVVGRSTQMPAPPGPKPAPLTVPRRPLLLGFTLNQRQAVDMFDRSHNYLRVRDTAIMEIEIARVALALTLYQIEHGEYPATLDELQTTLDWELPQDFFAGAPMMYQRRGDGFVLYSFGSDRDDDGGPPRRGRNRTWGDRDLVWECGAP